MLVLTVVCAGIAVLGLALIVLGLIPATSRVVPNGMGSGIVLVLVGVVLYVMLALLVHADQLPAGSW